MQIGNRSNVFGHVLEDKEKTYLETITYNNKLNMSSNQERQSTDSRNP